MSDTQRPGTSRSSVSPTDPDAADGLYLMGVPLGVELVDGEAFSVVDLSDDAVTVQYGFLPGARVVVQGISQGDDVVQMPSGYTHHPGEGEFRPSTIAMSEFIRAAFQRGKFAPGAQEARGDADAAMMSENVQPPRATPKYAEVRLTTPEQAQRRDDLVAISDARLEYMNLPWWKRLVSSRP